MMPLEWAEEVSQRMVHVEHTMDGGLFLEAEPTWAGAINMVLVSKGVRVSELARSSLPFLRGTEPIEQMEGAYAQSKEPSQESRKQ